MQLIDEVLLRLLDQGVHWNIRSGQDAAAQVRQLRDSILSRDTQIEQVPVDFLGLLCIANQLLFSVSNLVW